MISTIRPKTIQIIKSSIFPTSRVRRVAACEKSHIGTANNKTTIAKTIQSSLAVMPNILEFYPEWRALRKAKIP